MTQNCRKQHVIWQWNCRGFKHKRTNFQALLQSLTSPPSVIVLQEVNSPPKLLDYTAHQSTLNPAVAIFTHRNLVAIPHNLTSPIPHLLITILPPRPSQTKIHILNIYSPPKDPHASFALLFKQALTFAGKDPIVICGDFNAPHLAWGYPRSTRKGRLLWELAQQLQLTTYTDPSTPTRIGNSVQRDTHPDLTFSYNMPTADWQILPHSLGSDHYIIELAIPSLNYRPPRSKQPSITNWDAFRQDSRTIPAPHSADQDALEEWLQALLSTRTKHDHPVHPATPSPYVDSRMQHLWEAYCAIEKRWRQHKHNRTLKRKLARLQLDMQQHAKILARANWNQLCDSLNGTLSTKRTWAILRHLLNPENSKHHTNGRVQQLIHSLGQDPDTLLSTLKQLYIPPAPEIPELPDYTGPPNDELDAPITFEEVKAALLTLRRHTAPGADGVTNTLLRHLDDLTVDHLTTVLNTHWQDHTLPSSWTHSDITLIPKPNKPLGIPHLRPISLTSCLGKLLEHVIHDRITYHLERNNILPPNMLGFRPHLSTQDALIQVHHDLLLHRPARDNAALLSLDLHKAFDNISHSAILRQLTLLGFGPNTFAYIRNFLSPRTATIRLGALRSPLSPCQPAAHPKGLSYHLFCST